MKPLSLKTDQIRRLLVKIRKRQLPYTVTLAEDLLGPGGGVYVRAQTPVTLRHITWCESRNPAPGRMPTFMEVVLSGPDGADQLPSSLELPASDPEAAHAKSRAREAAGEVVQRADAAARLVRGIHDQLGQRFDRTQLSSPQIIASFHEFDREFRKLHTSVRRAVDEYLGGNALVLGLIADHDLERPAVRHAVRVAALAIQLLFRCPPADSDDDALHQELVHLFLGGFLHDCGTWDEPYCFAEGHEARGAALAGAAVQMEDVGARLEKMVLFHSNPEALTSPGNAAFVRLEGQELYRMLPEGPAAGVEEVCALDERDRRDALALALSERWISELDEVQFRHRNHRDLLAEMVDYTGCAPGTAYVAALCNMEVEVVAPRRACVALSGTVPMTSPKEGRKQRLERVDVEGYAAGSLGHDENAAAPHLITLFASDASGQRRPLRKTSPKSAALWERATGPDSRCYVSAGRFKNMLFWEVTGFFGEEEYARILGPYELELPQHLG